MCSLTCIKLNWWLRLLCSLQWNGILVLPCAGEITTYPSFVEKNYFGLVKDLVALDRLLVVCLKQHELFVSPCVTLFFLQVWLGVTAAPLVPSYTFAQRNWVSTGHMWNVTLCQLVFPGISLSYKQFFWNSVSHLMASEKLHFACCWWQRES